MIDPLMTLAVSGLALATALLIVSRIIPDEYDRRAVVTRRRETPRPRSDLAKRPSN